MHKPILTNIVVIYHADCRDGFSAAYAAWKKFGDGATYIPRKTQLLPPEGLGDKEMYILDYSYSKETLDKLVRQNRSVTVIDHHQTAETAVTSFPHNVFDQSHSGATLSWMHFHPHTPMPKLLLYIEEHDLWKNTLPHSGEIAAIIGEYPFTFETWDKLAAFFEDETSFKKLVEKGAVLRSYIDKHIAELVSFAELVTFEGHEVYAVNCARPYRSAVGNALAENHPPFSIVWYHYDGAFHISLRSTGDFDVAKIAEKYGGGGHKRAAGFQVQKWKDIPFQFKDLSQNNLS
jgi:oligoribonuclease NrnB/cAMP/cGMP phosphodiesterase (DHH superfamily)